MSTKNIYVATLSGFCAVLLGMLFLTGCSLFSKKKTGTSAITLSPATLTFASGVDVASSPQSVTVTNSGTATLTLSGIAINSSIFTENTTCGATLAAAGTCAISVIFTPTVTGAATGTLSITDNASGSPQTVALSGTGSYTYALPTSLTFSGVTAGSTSAAQVVTFVNAGTTSIAVTSITATTGFNETNTCGTSLAANSSCTISVTYSATGSGNVSGGIIIVDTSGTQTVSLTASNNGSDSDQAQVTVGFGVNGNTGDQGTNYYNGIFTTVTVCSPGSTTNCVSIPNVLVDTGSVGLRVLSTALTGVTLPQIDDPSTGNPLYECVQYGDLSYTWGPMQRATVQVGGETASQIPTADGGAANQGIPIQVIAADQTPPSQVGLAGSTGSYYDSCLYYTKSSTPTGGLNDDTTTNLGANGILGIGTNPQDCGADCTSISTTHGYLVCDSVGSSTCDIQVASLADQAWNPAAAFPTDNNGVSISLGAIPATGASAVSGTLTFGIGTESNNAIPSTAAVYELDSDGNFASATFNGTTVTSANSGGTFIDSGSNAYYVSDDSALATSNCIVSTVDIGYYCPSVNLSPSLGLTGSNGASTTVTLSIENAASLFNANPSFAAFNDLGGPSCIPSASAGISCTLTNEYFDLGLPFFFGNPVFVGIYGTNSSYPNGYWAF